MGRTYMKQPDRMTTSQFDPVRGGFVAYCLAFIFCLIASFVAYALVELQWLEAATTVGIIAVLAVLQCAVQLRFFLHVGKESRPRWKLLVFGLFVLLAVVIVGGSLWIMDHLNYNMMHDPASVETYINEQHDL